MILNPSPHPTHNAYHRVYVLTIVPPPSPPPYSQLRDWHQDTEAGLKKEMKTVEDRLAKISAQVAGKIARSDLLSSMVKHGKTGVAAAMAIEQSMKAVPACLRTRKAVNLAIFTHARRLAAVAAEGSAERQQKVGKAAAKQLAKDARCSPPKDVNKVWRRAKHSFVGIPSCLDVLLRLGWNHTIRDSYNRVCDLVIQDVLAELRQEGGNEVKLTGEAAGHVHTDCVAVVRSWHGRESSKDACAMQEEMRSKHASLAEAEALKAFVTFAVKDGKDVLEWCFKQSSPSSSSSKTSSCAVKATLEQLHAARSELQSASRQAGIMHLGKEKHQLENALRKIRRTLADTVFARASSSNLGAGQNRKLAAEYVGSEKKDEEKRLDGEEKGEHNDKRRERGAAKGTAVVERHLCVFYPSVDVLAL